MARYIVPAMLIVDADSPEAAVDTAGQLRGWHVQNTVGVLIDERLDPVVTDPVTEDPMSLADFYPFSEGIL